MKKIILLFLAILNVLTIVSCKKEKEDINTPKEFKTGDIVIYNGVIYEYLDMFKDINSLSGKEALEYVFTEEEDYKAFYSTYYLDMSDYKNQPKLKYDPNIMDLEWDFSQYHSTNASPTRPYAFYIPTYFYDESFFKHEREEGGSFIVKGYTENLPKDVVIPMRIHGKRVSQIGYRAFENAPMLTLTLESNTFRLIHPYAISHCNNLKEITGLGCVMSMGISNCENLEYINEISPTMDCSLYNLPMLEKIENFHFFLNDGYPFPETCYGLGGIRKSYFYNCPRLSSITGETEEHNITLSTTFNTVYINFWYRHSIPLYVYNHYTAVIEDSVFTDIGTWVYTVLYNPDTLEAYVPFLNDGLEKEGTILFRHHKQGPEAVTEDETGIYINATYYDSKYNAKLLFKRE